MQERAAPNLFDIIDKRIEYLCEFIDENKQKFCHWCVGVVTDVSDGMDNPKWKRSATKCYGRGKAAKIEWEALFGEEASESIVQLKPGK